MELNQEEKENNKKNFWWAYVDRNKIVHFTPMAQKHRAEDASGNLTSDSSPKGQTKAKRIE